MRRCVLATLLASALAAPAAHAELSHNLTQAYADTLLAMQNGAGSIVCIGDSLTSRPGALFESLRHTIIDHYGDGGLGYRGCSIWTGTSFSPTVWSRGVINSDTSPFHSLDGMWATYVDTVPAWMEVTAYDPVVTLHYTAQIGGGSFIVRYPDSTFQRIQTYSPVQEVRTLSITMPAGSPPNARIRLEPQPGGTVTFLGTDNRTQNAAPRIHRVANGGWGVNSFLHRNWTFDQQLVQLQPSLILVMLGQNDPYETRATFGAKMIQLVDRLRAATPQAEIVLISSYDASAPWNVTNGLGMEDAALARTTGYIDLFHAGGTHATFAANGYLDPDGVHWSPAGGTFVAELIFNALETGGESLHRCPDIDFNNDGLSPDTQDISDFLNVFTGADCPTPAGACDTIDFNRDDLFPDTQDITDFLNVFSGGGCS